MEFQKMVEQIISEEVISGGEGSAFGPNASQPYGDNIGSDARNVFLYPGVITRNGKSKKRKKRKSQKK